MKSIFEHTNLALIKIRLNTRILATIVFCMLIQLVYSQINDKNQEKYFPEIEVFRNKVSQTHWQNLPVRLKRNNELLRQYGIKPYEKRAEVITGYYNECYDWDLLFENVYMSYFGISKFCRTNLEMFLRKQLENGFVPRLLYGTREFQPFKPFLAQVALLGSKQTGSYLWINEEFYNRLKKSIDFWFWYCDLDKNGLVIWNSADHAMDNQWERVGKMNAMVIEGVDLNTYMVVELRAMSIIAKKLGHTKDAEDFSKHATDLAELINKTFWDEKEGFYYDRHERTGEYVKIKSASGLIPLWAGIVPKDRAKRLIEEHLLNKNEFWLEYPVATYSKSDPLYNQSFYPGCSWTGPTWIPINYMIFHGLMKYGYNTAAEELAYKTFKMVMNEDESREYYNAETGVGLGRYPFWGWTSLAYFMPLEFELKYNPLDVDQEKIIPVSHLLKVDF